MANATEMPYKPDDLRAITDRPMPELIGGELVEREPMGQGADAIAAVLISLLVADSRENFPGVVNGSQGGYRIFADDPKKVRFPDVSFTRTDRLPGGEGLEPPARIGQGRGPGRREPRRASLRRSPPARRSPCMASPEPPPPADEPESRPGGVPLYVWVIGAVILAIPTGLALGLDASRLAGLPEWVVAILRGVVHALDLFPNLIIRALGTLAAPLVVLAILSAIVTNDVRGAQGARMMLYYLINTLVAMAIGLTLSNAIRPGKGTNLATTVAQAESGPKRLVDVLAPARPRISPPPQKKATEIITELVPKSVGDAFATNNLAQLVLLTLPLGIGLAQIRNAQIRRGETSYLAVVDVLTVGFELLMKVLLWVVALVPLAVFGVVAMSVAREGYGLFVNLGYFIVTVIAGLLLQLTWYLAQLGFFARMSPNRFLRGAADVMATTFSTSSTAATMPITLRSLVQKLGVSRASSQLAACVGTNFNNDGTALYQAVAALFFAQALGMNLSPMQQVVVVLTTLVASVGAGGIPSGSFVTMPLIFASVGLPADKLPILLTIDWFLDRCRTTSNVLGDMTVAVLLDRTAEEEAREPRESPDSTDA